MNGRSRLLKTSCFMTTCDLHRDFLGLFASLKKLLKSAYVSLAANAEKPRQRVFGGGSSAKQQPDKINLFNLELVNFWLCIVLIAAQLLF